MTDTKTKPPTNTVRVMRVADLPLEQHVRRIRWQTGVSETTARTIAGLYFGEGR